METNPGASSLRPDDPVLKDAIQKMVGDVTLIRGHFNNLFYTTAPANSITGSGGWQLNADGTWTLGLSSAFTLTPVTAVANFDTAGRYQQANGGTSSVSFNTNNEGVSVAVLGGGNGYARNHWLLSKSNNAYLFSGNPVMTALVNIRDIVNDALTSTRGLVCVGDVAVSATAHTFTDAHFGFEFARAASGVVAVYASCADGATHTTSLLTSNVGTGEDVYDCYAAYTTGTSIVFRLRRNGGTVVTATLTTNLPPAATVAYKLQQSVSGENGGANVPAMTISVASQSYQR